jgi:hypothetical protein
MLTFSSPGGTFWCSLQSWQRVAKLAADRGWSPSGIPRPASSDGSDEWAAYLPGDFPPQEFAGDDADKAQTEQPWYSKGIILPVEDSLALAEALETALPDIPRFDALSEKVAYQLDLPSTIPFKVLNPGVQVSNYEFFSGPNRQALERFITLCRAGPVTVS